MNLALDWSFYNWELISQFVLKGFYFSVMLTVIATLGGVFFGTLLALMRLSGKAWLVLPATIYVNGMKDDKPTVFAVKGAAEGCAASWSQQGGNPSKTEYMY